MVSSMADRGQYRRRRDLGAAVENMIRYDTRVCRLIGLPDEDCTTVCRDAINWIGFGDDIKKIAT